MIKYFIFLAVFFCSVLFIDAQSNQIDHDAEFWSDTTLVFPVYYQKDDNGKKIEKIDFLISGTFRGGKNFSKPVDERIGAGFDFFVHKNLTLTTSYLYRAGQPPTGGKEFEHRIRFEATPGNKWKYFSLKDRNRFEYRIRNSRADSWRYRNKLTFTIPVTKDKKELFAPFIADEVFYDFHAKKWNRDEFSVGISKKFNKHFSTDFYYLFQSNREAALKYVNVLGVNFKYKID